MNKTGTKIKVAVVGGSGYTGVELIRLLLDHPSVDLVSVTSRSEAGCGLADVFPHFRGHPAAEPLVFELPELDVLEKADIVFFATPNGTAMKSVRALVAAGVRVIDLAADFRLESAEQWEEWYNMAHEAEDVLAHAVYGLADLFGQDVSQASVVANPGCYPTSVQLPLRPLIAADLIDVTQPIIADCKSGVSGAGRSGQVAHSYAEVSEDFTAYGIEKHRHWIEIYNGLKQMQVDSSVPLDFTFTPHLLPMPRGIFSTVYASLKDPTDTGLANAREVLRSTYEQSPFVHLLPEGTVPHTKSVRGGNSCHFNVFLSCSGKLVVASVIDNLLKGAAGQAVQNMNLMFQRPVTEGLAVVGITP